MNVFKIGDKVIPIKKSFGVPLEDESHWKHAQAKKQPFMYIVNIDKYSYRDPVNGHYELSHRKSDTDGNHWKLGDFIPFEQQLDAETLFTMLVKGEIEESMYEELTSNLPT